MSNLFRLFSLGEGGGGGNADITMQVVLLQKVKCNNAVETRIQMKTNVTIQTDTHAQLI